MLDNSAGCKFSLALLLAVFLFYFQAAAAIAEDAVEQLLQASDRALSSGQVDEAAAHARQALQLDATNAEAHNQLGLCLAEQHQFEPAAEQFKLALDGNPAYLPGLHNLASMYYRSGSYSQAIEFFEEELQKQTQIEGKASARTLTSLADAYRDRANARRGAHDSKDALADDFRQALSYYNQAAQLEPDSAALHNHLGVYYFEQGDLRQAEAETRRATELKSDYAAAYYNLALVLEKQGRLDEASAALRSSLQYENEPEYRRQVADRLSQLGAASAQKQQARDMEMTLASTSTRSLNQESKQQAETGADYLMHARQLLRQSNFRAAELLLRKAVDGAGRGDAVAWNNLGYALAMQARYNQAVSCYRRALKLSPGGFACAQYNLGQVLRQLGDLSGAERCFKLAVERAGGMNALAHNALGLCYKHERRLEAACSEYKLAILQCGDTLPVVHFNLGLALQAQSTANKDAGKQAIAQFERYLLQAPHGLNAEAARARLLALKHS